MIYLDNAATTMRKPQEVIDAITAVMCSMGNAGRGVNEASLGAARTVYDTREKLAGFFGAEDARQIVFTMNSTESLNIAIKGILNPGDHVISTVLEHNSVLRPLYEMEKKGVEVTFLGCDEKGTLDYADFDKAIKENTKAIVCTHGSNLTGNKVDVERIGEIAKKHDLLFVVDASQTAGVFPIDVQKMHIDILCFTGHKGLLGPQGTGGMYVRKGVHVRPLLSGGTGVQTYSKTQPEEMPTALEAGTLNGHGIAGLDAAIGYLEETGIDTIRAKEQALMKRFYEGVKEIPGVKIYGDFSSWDGPDADYTPVSDDIPWCMVPEKKVTVEDVKYVLSSHYQGTPYDPYGAYGDKSMNGAYRSIGINRNDFMSLIQMRPDQPEDSRAIEWVAFASNAFNVMAPFYADIDETPEYFANTTGEVSTENFYWSSRMIAAMADASYKKSIFHIERYQEHVMAKAHQIINRYDDDLTKESDIAKRMQIKREANREIAKMVKKETSDTLSKVLYELSNQMKNSYARSDA